LPAPAELANVIVRLKKLTQLQRFVAPNLVAVWLLSPSHWNWRELETKNAESNLHHSTSATIRAELTKMLVLNDIQYMWDAGNIAFVLPILPSYITIWR